MQNRAIKKAAELITAGELVAFPTETVYGLGANAFNNEACLKIFKTKGRPANNPLIVHVLSLEQANELAIFNEDAYKLSILWPGPLTMVLSKKSQKLASSITADLSTVAVRIPAHQVARKLLKLSNLPIAAPSANKSGRLSPTTSGHVSDNFGNDVFVLEEFYSKQQSNNYIKYGVESTIIDLSTDFPTILRLGFITPNLIEQILGKKIAIATNSSQIKAPGMMHTHYAPKTPLRINAKYLEAGEIGLDFGKSKLCREYNQGDEYNTLPSNLSSIGNLAEAASNLFNYLHLLDDYAKKNHFKTIAIAPIPNIGIGLAINDRLIRGATKK